MNTLNTGLLSLLAMLLVVNSHLDDIYPLGFLATGGSIGNSIFFTVSGYGLAMSFKKTSSSIIYWYLRRIKRIYPTAIAVIGTACLIGLEQIHGFFGFVQVLIWPTSFWFIEAIMLFYILYYGVEKFVGLDKSIYVILFLFIPYFVCYYMFVDLTYFSIEASGYFKWIFYFQIMLLGAFVANARVIGSDLKWLLLFFFIFAYFGLKAALKVSDAMEYQFVIHLSTFPLIYFMLISIGSIELKNSVAEKLVVLFGGIAFEVYLIHVYILHSKVLEELVFPKNLIVLLLLSFSLSILVSKVVASFLSGFKKDQVVRNG